MLTGGRAAVAIFFVISGFSLSYKPIKLLRINDYAHFSEAMTSSVFRRWLRLFLPVTIIIIFEMLAAYAGFFKRRPQDGIPQGQTFASQFDH
jgi:peptidoglycan/LPS O-acetylase OafA/YrhL